MRTANFAQDLLSVQTELLNFAYKLTADREEANDLLQETSLKALAFPLSDSGGNELLCDFLRYPVFRHLSE